LYDYAVLRVVPRVEREEFINVGVILSCPALKFLQVRIDVDPERVRAFDKSVDMESLLHQLDGITVLCNGGPQAGPIGLLTQRERFKWLVAPKSTIIQTSPVHTGWCSDPEQVLTHLLNTMVRKSAGN
jgi:hypothetical protein